MFFPTTEQFETLESVQAFFDKMSDGLMLVDRKWYIKLVNSTVEKIMKRPKSKIIGLTIGEGLGCIHTGDSRDGCGYGSICGYCIVLNVIKYSLRSQKYVLKQKGKFAMGVGDKLIRPRLDVSTHYLMIEGQRYVMMAIHNPESIIAKH
ncbi:MAG: hypothetical protein B6242_04850 [Anaerolineaceae bacterium 4572_78]|nr:MAG: hypothetical protein B6242_04850 [Anaerolineaceae bacterium 4572_78]